ncbi:MAG: 30S ribosomal protein S15 [Archaeoglobaceae archaeon]|nr:30S ribosomal protein S15 [Archaeoglobaceae archaeon]MCX8152217.1 30S ribosomal protein S15 [Archaeoglobaceae archaeon]MDW8014003.1 30S ribosomal protein S15 [Archaeoglobaceae archaeon]
MARMHAKRRGKSGSKKVYRDSPPEWVTMKAEEVEKKILELYNEGYEPSVIGMILRDRYGIPSVRQVTGKKLVQILKEQGVTMKYPEDLKALIKKALNLRKHLEFNKKDKHNARGLQLIEAKIWRLSNYYKEVGVLPEDWKYDPEKLRIELG